MQNRKKSALLKLTFTKKAADAINMGNILYQEVIVFHIPPYFKNVSLPNISNEARQLSVPTTNHMRTKIPYFINHPTFVRHVFVSYAYLIRLSFLFLVI